MTHTVSQDWGTILFSKTFETIEHEEIGTYTKTEISQDEDNTQTKK